MTAPQDLITNYLWCRELPGIDNNILYEDCLRIEDYISNVVVKKTEWDIEYGSASGREYRKYNVFLFPSDELNKLFYNIREAIEHLKDPNETYVIQSWLNVYRENKYIDWHNHWPAHYKAFHGFYCVNSENTPSYTDYKFPTINDDVTRVVSKDGLLVYGKSENDQHRSSDNWQSSKPRVTIAFDIIPSRAIRDNFQSQFIFNHFIPI